MLGLQDVRLLARKCRNVECLSVLSTETTDLFKLTWRWYNQQEPFLLFKYFFRHIILSEDSFWVSPGSLAKHHIKPDPRDHIHMCAVLAWILHLDKHPAATSSAVLLSLAVGHALRYFHFHMSFPALAPLSVSMTRKQYFLYKQFISVVTNH